MAEPSPVTSPALLVATAIFSLWSVEGFGYAAVALGLMILVAAATRATSLRGATRLIGVDLLRLAAACIAAHVLFAVGTRVLAGDWPDWGWYLAYLSSFSTSFGPVLVGQWSPAGLSALSIWRRWPVWLRCLSSLPRRHAARVSRCWLSRAARVRGSDCSPTGSAVPWTRHCQHLHLPAVLTVGSGWPWD